MEELASRIRAWHGQFRVIACAHIRHAVLEMEAMENAWTVFGNKDRISQCRHGIWRRKAFRIGEIYIRDIIAERKK